MVQRIFPKKFDLDEIKKFGAPRPLQFSDKREAFQALVGDALLHTFGNSAFVSTFLGNDGSIDAYIDDYQEKFINPFEGLRQLVIVECKHHDEAGKLRENILEGWRDVRGKLVDQSANGWSGLYEPWKRARSYVYCIGANIPAPEVHKTLKEKITEFFGELEKNGPSIDKVLVLGWNELKTWFDTIPALCNQWLGMGSSLIVTHAVFKESLTGFKEFLLPGKLDFVAPDEMAPFHPKNIFKKLKSGGDKNNVLIVGAGGVGKTRTTTEVAELASQEGWRVLHVLARDPGVDNEDLAKEVFPFPKKTLLILDYADQISGLNFDFLRSLISQARASGNELAVLGNSRPGGWVSIQENRGNELFSRIDLQPLPAQKQQIADQAIYKAAPNSCAKFKFAFVKNLCGERSIIALLIAIELERLVNEEEITEDKLKGIKGGDLVGWLRRRLERDEIGRERNMMGMPYPTPRLIMAAAILGCTPEKKDTLISVARDVGSRLGAVENAEFIVDDLIKLGWLETGSFFYTTPHDIVADEVFDQTVHYQKYVHKEALFNILQSSLAYPQILGRMAVTFERVLGAIENKENYTNVKEAAGNWLAENAETLGDLMTRIDTNRAGRSIASILSGDLWQAVAIEKWPELMSPWFRLNGRDAAAPHILNRALRANVDQSSATSIIEHAFDWLVTDKNYLGADADFVINRLLERKGQSGELVAKVIECAMGWLNNRQNYLNTAADFVFNNLLERRDELSEEQLRTVIDYSIRWLGADNNHLKPEADYVFNQLFDQRVLSEGQAAKVVEFAVEWLRKDNAYIQNDADFIYRRLLGRKELKDDKAKEVIGYAFKWLEKGDSYLKLEASYVMLPLLGRKELENSQIETVIGYGFKWLEEIDNHFQPEAGYVISPLLGRRELVRGQIETVVGRAFAWLENEDNYLKNYLKSESEFVLQRLLGRRDLNKEQAGKAVGYTFDWLGTEKNYLTPEAQFVLQRLLGRRELNKEQAGKAVGYTFDWLETEKNHLRPEAGFVLSQLLGRKELDKEQAGRAVGYAFDWLKTEENYLSPEAPFFLSPLLGKKELEKDQAGKAIGYAFGWLEKEDNHLTPEARFVLQPFLGRPELEKEQAGKAVGYAFDWLETEENYLTPETLFVLSALLGRKELDKEQAGKAVGYAFDWLGTEKNYLTPEAQFVYNPLLGRKEMDKEQAGRAVGYAFDWLEKDENYLTPEARFVLQRLLGRKDLDKEQAGRAVGYTFDWLETDENYLMPEAQFVYNQLLGRKDLNKEQAGRAVGYAFDWLETEKNYLTLEALFVLSPLLGRKELDKEQAGRAVGYTFDWLGTEKNYLTPEAGFVLQPLLGRNELEKEEAAKAVRYAFDWLEKDKNYLALEAGFVLQPLLGRNEMEKEEAAKAVRYTFDWLEKDENYLKPEARFVLQPLLVKKGLLEVQIARMIEQSMQWLKKHIDTQNTSLIIRNLIKIEEIGLETKENLIRVILQHLKKQSSNKNTAFLITSVLDAEIENPDLEIDRSAFAFSWLKLNGNDEKAGYVWKKLLRNQTIGNDEWRYVSDIALEWLNLPHGSKGDVNYTIYSILFRPRLLSEENLRWVINLGINSISSVKGEEIGDEIDKVYRSLKQVLGDIPEDPLSIKFNEVVESLGPDIIFDEKDTKDPFPEALKRIEELIESAGVIKDNGVLKSLLETIDGQAKYSIVSAGQAIVPLIILGLRSEGDIVEIISKTVDPLILSGDLSYSYKEKVKSIILDLVDRNLFTLSSDHEEWLERIGIIIRPQTES